MSERIFESSPAELAIEISNGKWDFAKHLQLINEKLLKVAKREIKKLIINMPPRHGKSELISHYFPFWYLSNFRNENVIFTTYSQAFANHFGKRLRSLFREFGNKMFGLELDKNYKSASEIKIDKSKGSIYCVGSGGSLTGRGADLMIIDDPIKNHKDASSAKLRDNLWDWFQSTAYTRLEPDAAIILVMTRWHEDDICGRLLESELNEWEVLKLPAIAEEDNDELNRVLGEPLWEKRFDIERLNKAKQSMGTYFFSGLYQQRPAPLEGGNFPKTSFKYFQTNEEFYLLDSNQSKAIPRKDCKIYSTMDLAMSTKETADYTVLLTFAVTPDKSVLVLDVIRKRMESSEHISLILNNYANWLPSIIGIESVQFQTFLINHAREIGLPIQNLKADKDKLTRSYPIANLLSAGKVYFQQNAHWLYEFERELMLFPNATHDDQVDAFSYICQMIAPISNFDPFGKGKRDSKFNGYF